MKVAFIIFSVLLSAIVTDAAAQAINYPEKVSQLPCSMISWATVLQYRQNLGIPMDEWGTPEWNALIERIKNCSQDPRFLQMAINESNGYAKAIDGRRQRAEQQRQQQEYLKKQSEDDERARNEADLKQLQAQQRQRISDRDEKMVEDRIHSDLIALHDLNITYLSNSAKRDEEQKLEQKILSEIASLPDTRRIQFSVDLEKYAVLAPLPLTDEERAAKEKAEADAHQQAELEEQRHKEAEINEKRQKLAEGQAQLVAAELFIERHCTKIVPDHDMFESIKQDPDSPHFIDPEKLTFEERSNASTLVSQMEKNGDSTTGFIPGSPMDLKFKCAVFENTFVNTLHIYKRDE